MSVLLQQNLVLHHIGCVTESIDKSTKIYKHLGFANASKTFVIKDQDVKVCFIETAPGIFIELVEPMGQNPSLHKLLKSKNPFYHVGYLTGDVDNAVKNLQEDGFYLVNEFYSEAFDNKKCAFLYTPEMHLIELIQR